MQSGGVHKFLLLLILLFIAIANCALAANRLIINEIMINEPGSETSLEWIELFNAGDDSLNLKDFIFIEAADTTRFSSRWLSSHAFVVLARKPLATDATASFERQWGNASNVWGDDSLENYILLPTKMSLRNSNDSVTLVDLASGTTETVKWHSSPPDGVSLERVNPMTLAAAKNFKYCKSSALSTPGRVNSVIAKMRDWGFIEDDCEIFIPTDPDRPVQFQLSVGNFGQSAAASLLFTVVFDRDFNGVFNAADSSVQFQFGQLSPDSVLTRSLELPVAPGHHAFILQLPPDDDSSGNTIRFECVVGPVAREMLVTEFICNDTDSCGCEWIELQSVADFNLSLQGWTLEVDGKAVPLDTATQIQPAGKIILCEDSNCFRRAFSNIDCQILQPSVWRPLPNTAGTIVLRMALAAVSDSLSYRGNIEPGRSWERDLDSNSTFFESQFYRSTAALGSTPCGVSSIRPVPIAVDLDFVKGSLTLTKDTLDNSRVIAKCLVENRGYRNSQPAAIRVFDDSNRDGRAQESELIMQPEIPTIAAGDSTPIEIVISPNSGRHTFIFALPEDDIPRDDTIAATISVGPLTRELLITEFIANPETDLESEWFEIRNTSGYSVNLQGWTFGDASHQSLLEYPEIIPPGAYLVLAQNPAAFAEFYGPGCAPLSCRTWSNLNNSGDIIIARDEFGTLSDSISFVRVADNNRSMERAPQTVPGLPEWNPSVALSGSSPCAANSLQPTPLALDIGLVAESLHLERDSLDVSIAICRISLKNFGYLTVPHASVDIFDDRNHDGHFAESEFLTTLATSPISPGDTCAISTSVQLSTGRHSLILALADDENLSNNIVTATITTGTLTHELIITEFLADPASPLETEWIELRNLAAYPINLTGWSCGDRSSMHSLDCTFIVTPGDYFVIAQDSAAFAQFYGEGCRVLSPQSWPSLNNSGDLIILRDEFGTISDSLTFIECVGTNRSLERNESSDLAIASWYPSTALSGSTPCTANSVSGNYEGKTSLTLLNRVFSPLAGEELRFSLQCPPASKFTIEIFDLSGRRQHVVADAQYFSSGEFAYDGVSDHTGHLSIGAYILKIESENGDFSQKVGFAVAPPK